MLGAGLAGLSAARDLAGSGADVVVLEARDRVGGRVEAVTLPDGRVVQGGGEVFGHDHHAYRELVEELPLAQRQVVTLRDEEGLPGADVCDILGISEGNQRVLLHRARARIRRHLEQEAVW